MPEAVTSPYRVPFDGTFRVAEAPTTPPAGEARDRDRNRDLLEERVERISDLQRILWAHDHHAVLLVFQAMDAAGKDGTIRAVLSGVNPAGCRVSSFKAPSSEELEHDFLWRTTRWLPERGQIGVFNRSYYEEVLVVRVHPRFLEGQRLVRDVPPERLWAERFESIREHERHLARNGTLVLKFFLHVSREEQRRRFLDRLEEPDKRWKFRVGDVEERMRWGDYMHAYQEALAATSRPWAPWYAIPADDKPFMRATVADIVARSLEGLDLRYPQPREEDVVRFAEMRHLLEAEGA
ncbi:MAG TPA: PPK2 family polyphosphate kinase [Longimicrobiales bacterium]|nr:PPK2 family polyphosphate kinase [Longimicrobiales bacterium]